MRGLVLEGGGARGSYHVGVYKALLEEDIKIDGITGTSIGALNGAMIVQGDFDTCYNIWNNISLDRVVDLGSGLDLTDFSLESINNLGNQLKKLIKNKGLDITPLKDLMKEYIDEEKIRNSEIDFGMVTVNLSDMKPMEIFKEDIPSGQLKDYLLASAYLPSFQSEKIGGKFYLDGAFFDNLPFNMLLDKGYDELILVRTHGFGLTRDFDAEAINALVITPSQDLGRGSAYDSESARRNIKMGYYDALRVLRGNAGTIYNIEVDKDEEYFFELLNGLSEAQLEKIKELAHETEMPGKRFLFEEIIPRVASELKLKRNSSYKDVIIGMLERKARFLKIDEFNIYSFENFVELINMRNKSTRPKEKGVLEVIIDRTELTSLLNMERLILDIVDIILGEYTPLLENRVVGVLEEGINEKARLEEDMD